MDSVTLLAPTKGGNAVRVLGYVEAFLLTTPISLPRHSAPSEKRGGKEEERIMGHSHSFPPHLYPCSKAQQKTGWCSVHLTAPAKNLRICPHSPCKTDLGLGNILPLPPFPPIILANTSSRFSLQSTVPSSDIYFLNFLSWAFSLFDRCEGVWVSELPLSISDLYRLQVRTQKQRAADRREPAHAPSTDGTGQSSRCKVARF